MINLINTSFSREIGKPVLFQPVLKPYPTHHSWIITTHISLGHLEHHWKYFSRQVDKTHQLLQFLSHQPAAPTHLISTPQVELTNINDIFDSCKPTIISAINLLNTDPSFDGHVNSNNHLKRSLLHVLSSTIKQVYNAFFYSTSTHLLSQQSDEILFSHFMTTLNAAFESKLVLEDEGYESGCKNFKIHHVSSVKNASFDPDPVTPCSTGTSQLHHRPVHRYLTFIFSKDEDTPRDKLPLPASTASLKNHVDTLQHPSSKCTLNAYVNLEDEEEEEEDFPTVSLDDEH